MLSRRAFLALGASAVVLPATAGPYAWRIEPHRVEIVPRPMPLAGLPPALEGATLFQLSDLHVGAGVDSRYLVDTLRAAEELSPDFVVVTGG